MSWKNRLTDQNSKYPSHKNFQISTNLVEELRYSNDQLQMSLRGKDKVAKLQKQLEALKANTLRLGKARRKLQHCDSNLMMLTKIEKCNDDIEVMEKERRQTKNQNSGKYCDQKQDLTKANKFGSSTKTADFLKR